MKREKSRNEEKPFSRDPKGSASREDVTPQPAPLRPHRKLFFALLLVFLVWVGVLLAMYFKTVYPQRHGHPSMGVGTATRPGASGLPSAPR